MAIEGFSPPSPSPPPPPPHYQLLERGSARLGRVKKHHLLRVGPKQLFALVQLGCTRAVVTS